MDDWWLLDRVDDRSYNSYPDPDEVQLVQPVPESVSQVQKILTPSIPHTSGQPVPCTSNHPKGPTAREIRNNKEKLRRDKMNRSISRLATIVPPVVISTRKLDKISVLRLTAHFLRSHDYVFGDSLHQFKQFSSGFIRSLMKTLKGFFLTTTYKGIIVVVSPNVQDYLGYNELELLGQNVFNIVHEEDRALLKEHLQPMSSILGSKGELLLPGGPNSEHKLTDLLASDKRSFLVRFKKLRDQNSGPPVYVTCHVDGSFRKADKGFSMSIPCCRVARRGRTRTDNCSVSGNDVVFVGLVRPITETFFSESAIESSRMEYRTRHSVDGEILQCEQRLSLITGYMTHEVYGINAMNFMHKDDVRWVVIALRQMYDQNRIVGESCYRLMTKNGQFIYMRTCGRLDVDPQSKAVTTFVCNNTVVDEREGKRLIKLMKKKYQLLIENKEDTASKEDITKEIEGDNDSSIEDPRELQKVILHLVTNLKPPQKENYPDYVSGLKIIPPKRERIVYAIEKIYNVVKDSQIGKMMQDTEREQEMEQPTKAQEMIPTNVISIHDDSSKTTPDESESNSNSSNIIQKKTEDSATSHIEEDNVDKPSTTVMKKMWDKLSEEGRTTDEVDYKTFAYEDYTFFYDIPMNLDAVIENVINSVEDSKQQELAIDTDFDYSEEMFDLEIFDEGSNQEKSHNFAKENEV